MGLPCLYMHPYEARACPRARAGKEALGQPLKPLVLLAWDSMAALIALLTSAVCPEWALKPEFLASRSCPWRGPSVATSEEGTKRVSSGPTSHSVPVWQAKTPECGCLEAADYKLPPQDADHPKGLMKTR